MTNLSQFQRPQRYAGNEWNVVKKNHAGKIPICLCFPDLYDVGMSNLGLRILYGMLNTHDDIVCERVFMPGSDLADYLCTNEIGLFSLESKVPVNEFEVVGFTFSYELNFTNFLHILHLSKIPLRSDQRENQIVIAGGLPNPVPLSDFVDVFFIGEFEDSCRQFIQVLLEHKEKSARLNALAKLDGFYIPSLHKGEDVRRVYVKDMDRVFFPVNWLTPHTQIVHDRVPIEVARGCPNGCTFCQARAVYNPYRERSVERIEELIRETYAKTGYENFSLLSLSTSDYSRIGELLDRVTPFLSERKIGLSMPSLRIDDLIGPLFKKLALIKKSSITVAIEAAGDDLRTRLNKRIDPYKIFEVMPTLRAIGIRHIKLYFMYGFPGETDSDLLAIGAFIDRLNREGRIDVHASINIFVPKPFAVWQNYGMDSEAEILRKQSMILGNIPRRRSIKIDTSNIKRSLLEGISSRADKNFGSVIERAFLKGARLDSYSEHFNWQLWQEAFNEIGIDHNQYLKDVSGQSPWGFIK